MLSPHRQSFDLLLINFRLFNLIFLLKIYGNLFERGRFLKTLSILFQFDIT